MTNTTTTALFRATKNFTVAYWHSKHTTKITKGGSGAWGAIPMPANPQVNDADAKKLAGWVLSL